MAFIFPTSHLPETRARRPDHMEEEEDEEVMQQPPPRAGMVRAFSHLPEPRPLADSSGPLSTRPATPVGRPRPHVDPVADIGTEEDRDTDHAPGPDSDHDDVTRAHEYENAPPWHQPRITAQDRPPQVRDEDQNGSGLNRPIRDSRFDDTHSAERSASTTHSNNTHPSTQDLRDTFHPPAPDSPTKDAPAQDSTAALTRGLIFEKRAAPESFLREQMRKGASEPSSQERLPGAQQVLAAQQPGRSPSPSSPQQGMQLFQAYAPAPQQQGGRRLTLGQGPASPPGTVQPQNQGQQTPPPPARDQEKQTGLEKNSLENVPEKKSLNTARPPIDPNKILWLKNAVDAGDRQAVYDAVRQNIIVEGIQLSDKLTPLEKLRLTTESNRIANKMIDEIVSLAFLKPLPGRPGGSLGFALAARAILGPKWTLKIVPDSDLESNAKAKSDMISTVTIAPKTVAGDNLPHELGHTFIKLLDPFNVYYVERQIDLEKGLPPTEFYTDSRELPGIQMSSGFWPSVNDGPGYYWPANNFGSPSTLSVEEWHKMASEQLEMLKKFKTEWGAP